MKICAKNGKNNDLDLSFLTYRFQNTSVFTHVMGNLAWLRLRSVNKPSPTTELRDVTCRQGSHSITCHPTSP